MSLVLREVLTHPALVHADPRLLSGDDQLDHPVRWVHSADLYDIAPLLRGDEVLLTNGVGLVAVDDAARRTYVRRLAERSVAALFFEIGRTFPRIPDAMVDEARRLGLALVMLEPVLRFTEVAEAVNSEIIDRSVVRLRYADEISRTLSEALVRGGTVSDILELVAAAARSRAVLYDSADQIVVSAGDPAPEVPKRAAAEAPILIDGTVWGRLTIGPTSESDQLVEAILDRAPRVIELCLIREQPTVAATFRVKQLLLEQLARGVVVSNSILEDRLRAAGMPAAGHDYVCLVLDAESVADAARVADAVGRRYGECVFGFVAGSLCALVAARPDATGHTLSTKVVDLLRSSLAGRKQVGAAVSGTAHTPHHLPRLMAETRLALTVAAALGSVDPVVRTRVTALERLLRHVDRDVLRHFVVDALGPLTDPATKDGELLETLEVFVQCRGSKTEAASRLHIRRQSLYYRLRKIAELLELNLDDPTELGVLAAACTARRVLDLTGLDLGPELGPAATNHTPRPS